MRRLLEYYSTSESLKKKDISGKGELTLSRWRKDCGLRINTLNNWLYGINPVLCLYTHLYMFLEKTTQHVDSGTCFYMLSQFSCCACVYRDDIGVPVCQSLRCRRHSSHSVPSVHKKKKHLCKLCYFVLPSPPFFVMLFFVLSLSLCPFGWLADDLYLMNTTNWLWLKKKVF